MKEPTFTKHAVSNGIWLRYQGKNSDCRVFIHTKHCGFKIDDPKLQKYIDLFTEPMQQAIKLLEKEQ